MRYKAMIVMIVIVLMVALLVLPSIAGAAKAPPGLHKAPAAMKVNPHVVCIRCHTSPSFSGCMGAGCH
jgi:hypothetical protein